MMEAVVQTFNRTDEFALYHTLHLKGLYQFSYYLFRTFFFFFYNNCISRFVCIKMEAVIQAFNMVDELS